MTLFWAIYLAGFVCVWIFSTGAFFADIQDSYPGSAHEYWRKDLGQAALLAIPISLVWPLGWCVPILLTGFLEHGWTMRTRYRSERRP